MTLAEVLMASSILLICLISLAGVLSGSVTSSSNARLRDEATNLANQRIEIARSLAYDRVGLHYSNGVYGDPAGDIVTPQQDGKFTVTSECAWVRTAAGRAAYKQVTVHVGWQQPSTGEVVVTTMIYGKSNLAVNGDLVVMLRYREDAEPVVGATVAIHAADNSDRSVASNTIGEGFFGQVAIGAVALTVVPPVGCVVDTSTMSSTAIAADAVTNVIVYVQRPAQATIHVADTSGAALSGASVVLRRSDGTVLPSVVTDAVGNALITQLLYADYSAVVTKSGYSSATTPFTVSVSANAPIVPVSISPNPVTGIQVRVFDSNTTALHGATVTLRRDGSPTVLQTGTAGTNGEISFTGMNAGYYNVTVDQAGYAAQVKSTTMYDGDHDILDFHMVAASQGNMRITTRNSDGDLASIRVQIQGSGYFSDSLYSGADGILDLQNLVPGSYTVKCYRKSTSTATAIVTAGQTTEVFISQKH